MVLASAARLGAALVPLREEYSAVGIRLEDLRRPLVDLGLYHRTHASLIDDVLGAWIARPQRELLPDMPKQPLLVEVGDTERYRLGPDYPGADAMLRGAAALTEDGRASQKASKAPKGYNPRKHKGK
jgi:hypothetical protein